MTTYGISMPVTGYIYREVKANNEEEAKEKLHELELTINDIEDWDIHDHIVKGNVFYGILNDVYIREV